MDGSELDQAPALKKRRMDGTAKEQDVGDRSEVRSDATATCNQSLVEKAKDEPDAYYSLNFKVALSTVLSESPEKHVISEEDVAIVDGFMAMEEPEQRLYVRLLLRKHQWIRAGKLSYQDIAPDLSPVLSALISNGFLFGDEHLTDPRDLLNLLQLSELKRVCKDMNMPSSVVGSQKAKIVESLFQHNRQHRPLFGQATFLSAVVKRAKCVLGRCVKVHDAPVETFSKLILLYSMTDSDSTVYGTEDIESGFSKIIYRMLQVNTGRVVYPEYEISVTQPLFATKDQFMAFYIALKDQQQLIHAMEVKDTDTVDATVRKVKEMLAQEQTSLQDQEDFKPTSSKQSPPLSTIPYFRRFNSGWVHCLSLSHYVEFLEKQRQYQEANKVLKQLLTQRWFCQSSRGRWWDRLVLNLDHHLGKKKECLDVIQEALADSAVHPAMRLSLLQRTERLHSSSSSRQQRRKSCKVNDISNGRDIPTDSSSLAFNSSDFPGADLMPVPQVVITGRLLPNEVRPVYISSTDQSSTGNNRTLTGVEGFSAYYYSHTEGWPCVLHAEGSIFSTMFCILMWKVIFSPGIADVFRSSCQSGPLDLFTAHFYSNRRDLVDDRVKWIVQALPEDIGDAVVQCWVENHGKICTGLNWDLFPSVEDAKGLSMCMGGELLARVCEKFAKDFRGSLGGLPDLTLWNPSTQTCKVSAGYSSVHSSSYRTNTCNALAVKKKIES